MDKELLDEEKEKEVIGGTKGKSDVLVLFNGEESENVCTYCGKKYNMPKFLVDFSCPYCGYGGYKSIDGWRQWYENHKKDNI